MSYRQIISKGITHCLFHGIEVQESHIHPGYRLKSYKVWSSRSCFSSFKFFCITAPSSRHLWTYQLKWIKAAHCPRNSCSKLQNLKKVPVSDATGEQFSSDRIWLVSFLCLVIGDTSAKPQWVILVMMGLHSRWLPAMSCQYGCNT